MGGWVGWGKKDEQELKDNSNHKTRKEDRTRWSLCASFCLLWHPPCPHPSLLLLILSRFLSLSLSLFVPLSLTFCWVFRVLHSLFFFLSSLSRARNHHKHLRDSHPLQLCAGVLQPSHQLRIRGCPHATAGVDAQGEPAEAREDIGTLLQTRRESVHHGEGYSLVTHFQSLQVGEDRGGLQKALEVFWGLKVEIRPVKAIAAGEVCEPGQAPLLLATRPTSRGQPGLQALVALLR